MLPYIEGAREGWATHETLLFWRESAAEILAEREERYKGALLAYAELDPSVSARRLKFLRGWMAASRFSLKRLIRKGL